MRTQLVILTLILLALAAAPAAAESFDAIEVLFFGHWATDLAAFLSGFAPS